MVQSDLQISQIKTKEWLKSQTMNRESRWEWDKWESLVILKYKVNQQKTIQTDCLQSTPKNLLNALSTVLVFQACVSACVQNLLLYFLYIPCVTPHPQMQLARTTCEQENSTLLTWQEASVSPKQALLVSASARPPRSTSPSRPWGTSSLPWWMGALSTSHTGTPSWPGCCRTLWEETLAPWWSPASPRLTTTTRKAWAHCVMPTGPKASRTDLVLMRTPRKLCSESIRRKSKSCGPSSQASWAPLT